MAGSCESFQTDSPLLSSWSCVLWLCPWIRRAALCACSFYCPPLFSSPWPLLKGGLALPVTPLPSASALGVTAGKEHPEGHAGREKSLADCTGLCTWLAAEAQLCSVSLAFGRSLAVFSRKAGLEELWCSPQTCYGFPCAPGRGGEVEKGPGHLFCPNVTAPTFSPPIFIWHLFFW